jgi:hypothetical protein
MDRHNKWKNVTFDMSGDVIAHNSKHIAFVNPNDTNFLPTTFSFTPAKFNITHNNTWVRFVVVAPIITISRVSRMGIHFHFSST